MKLSKFIKYGSYFFLIFGFLYVSWHMGRAFEKNGSGAEEVRAVRTVAECQEAGELRRALRAARRAPAGMQHD